jgi:integrase
MSRRSYIPQPWLHQQTGQARVTLPDPSGKRQFVILGKFGSSEADAEYNRVISEWLANGRRLPTADRAGWRTVTELIDVFWCKHVTRHYVKPNGSPTSEQGNYRYALRALRAGYGQSLVSDFGPLSLKAIQGQMASSGLSRREVNRRIGLIRRCFKWGVSQELVPVEVYQRLATVEGLRKGRSAAPERPPIRPVEDDRVEVVLPFLNEHARGMVRVQRLTGMRPGEVCSLRPCDIDMSGSVWRYTIRDHKTAWRGKDRIVFIGPQAQEILLPFLSEAGPDEFVFSPRRMWRQKRLLMREHRRSRIPPSQLQRRKADPKRVPADRYSPQSYLIAVRRACRKAGVECWHPNQLRHATATAIRRAFSLDAAAAVLGHAKCDVTQVYAELSEALAEKVASQVG